MLHELKTWPEYFEPLQKGDKTFELRYDDRNYTVGDMLHLREFAPCRPCAGKGKVAWANEEQDCPDCTGTGGRYTGRSVFRCVTYLLRAHRALLRDYVVLGLHIPEL